MPGWTIQETGVYDQVAKMTKQEARDEFDSLIRHTDEDALDQGELRLLAFIALRMARGE